MIIDFTGVELIPGNLGKDCPGNGMHYDENGDIIECCCDECDYMLCCCEIDHHKRCRICDDPDCPHASQELIMKRKQEEDEINFYLSQEEFF